MSLCQKQTHHGITAPSRKAPVNSDLCWGLPLSMCYNGIEATIQIWA